jgi:hypothetical protein
MKDEDYEKYLLNSSIETSGGSLHSLSKQAPTISQNSYQEELPTCPAPLG